MDPEKGGEATQCVFDSRYTLVAVVRNEQTDINMVAFRGAYWWRLAEEVA